MDMLKVGPDDRLIELRGQAFEAPTAEFLQGYVKDDDLARKYRRAVSKKWKAHKKARGPPPCIHG